MALLVSRDFAAEVGGRKNSQSGPPDFVPPTWLAPRGLVDTFLPSHLRGFANTFLRTDKVCPGFGQRQRMGGATGTRPASPCHPASTFGWHLNLPIFFPKSW